MAIGLYFRTPKDKRAVYIYKSRTGEKFTLRPGEDGITSADINNLHELDDDAWNSDRREIRERKGVTSVVSFDAVDPDAIWIKDPDPLPDEITIKKETAQRVREAIDQLPEKQKNAVTAVWLEGKTARDYAADIGTPEYNISKQIKRAFNNLKKIFSTE